MERGVWKQPVILEIYGRPGSVVISSTVEAAMMLLRAWPAKRTEAHMIAVAACRDVLTGRAMPGLARADFIDAALDAGYHIQPETFLGAHQDWADAPDHIDRPDPQSSHELPNWAADTHPSPTRDIRPDPKPQMAVTWAEPLRDETYMRELLMRLAQVLGLILLEMLRGAAGMLNIGPRRRPHRQT